MLEKCMVYDSELLCRDNRLQEYHIYFNSIMSYPDNNMEQDIKVCHCEKIIMHTINWMHMSIKENNVMFF